MCRRKRLQKLYKILISIHSSANMAMSVCLPVCPPVSLPIRPKENQDLTDYNS